MAYPSSLFSSATSAEVDQGVPPSSPKNEVGASATDRHYEQAIAGLRTSISNEDWTLEVMLQQIAESARILTQADGAAIALRQGNAVICKAVAGLLAPDLGASLDTSSGISGECLRTATALRCEDTNDDTRVDAEVCRSLGLRSLAVVPLGAKAPAAGILEAFSGVPHSFPERHVALLQDLAELVMAAQRRLSDADSGRPLWPRVGAQALSAQVEPTSTRLRHRMQRLLQKQRETLLHASETRSGKRKLALVGISAIAMSLGLGWLVGHGGPAVTVSRPKADSAAKSRPAPPTQASAPSVWNANPAPAIPARSSKPSPSSAVVLATKTEKISTADDVLVRNFQPEPDAARPAGPGPPVASANPSADSTDLADNAPLLTDVHADTENPLNGVLSPPLNLPPPALAVSEGLTQGVVVHRVQPLYPAQARTLRLGGSVVLQAVVAEDGSVRDLSLVSGHPVLAHAAMSAVRQWRYRPFRLNGKPVAMRTEIKVDFKLPSD
jgi:TonB family protein